MRPRSPALLVVALGALAACGQHAALDADGGSTLYVSAFRDLGNFGGEIRMLRIELRK
jgi:hypothetical protein